MELLSSLRFRLLLLVVLCLLPALALILHTAHSQRQAALRDVAPRAARLARLSAETADRSILGVRQLLGVLSQLPTIREPDTEACNTLLADLLEQYPHYANIGLINSDGTVACSGLPVAPGLNLGDRGYFRRAMETKDFAVGEKQIGRITGVPSINFGQPVMDPDQEVRGVVFAALDLSWLSVVASTSMLPDGAELFIYDHDGAVLAQHPIQEDTPEARVPDRFLARGQRDALPSRLAPGLDGVSRLYAVVPLEASDGEIELALGLSEAMATAEARRLLRRNLTWLAIASAVALAVALVGGNLFVLRPIRDLVFTVARLRSGDLHARAGKPFGGGEIGLLARAFDEMADSLEFRLAERDSAREQLLRDAFHDRLTGLPNRALFLDRLAQAIERVRRGDPYAFAVLVLDLDRFKVINDSLGHLVGDDLLVAVARRIGECVRPGDTVSRLGGDEFAILLDDTTDGTSAVRIAERIQASLARPFPVGGSEVFTTASIGIVDATDEQESPEHFLRDADTAMYRAKKLGGGRHQVFDTSMHARAVELLKLETDLRRALERQELSLAYQPIVSLEDGRILGVEALMRWRHAERELVLPSEFIPLAEETGLISEIGEWALHAACAQAHAWRQAGLPRIYVSVNLSAQQFRHRDLAGVISRVLEETGLESSGLQLELTESCVMDHAEQTISTLRSLREVGVQLAVDDFGTGYSSLRYLRRFPIQALKIDQYFVRGIGVHPDDESIAGAIMALGNVLHLAVIAEGVETDAQLQFLRDQGCHAIQGSLFSTALPPDEVEALLRDDIRLPAADAAAILRRSAG